MDSIINEIFENADYFVLLCFRVGALFIASPIFGRTAIPAIAKIGFMGVLSYLFFIIGPDPVAIEYYSLFGFALLILKEVILGIALAYVTNLYFFTTYVAGQFMDMQMSFGMVNVYDPQSNSQVPITGQFFNMLLLIVFFLMDGHQRLIYLIYLTLEALPVGTLQLSPQIGLVALEIFSNAFALGIMIALPMIASGLILEFCFGALVRTVPQMNMFVVGMPLKVIVGFLMLVVLVPIFVNFSDRIFTEMFNAMDTMFGALRGV